MSYLSDNISLIRSNSISTAYDGGLITENTTPAYANLFYPYILDNGGNTNNISLTIGILNDNPIEESVVNKNWVKGNRLRDTLNTYKANWGFKETTHLTKQSKSLSNAFCFGGQVVTFYIETQGDGQGYIDGDYLYCKTTLIVKDVDVTNNTQSTLYTFSDFNKESNDTSRYFTWTIPDINNVFYANYGLFGLHVISLDISCDYYVDAQMQTLSSKNYPYKNQSHLQLLVYSAPKEIIEVNAGECNIIETIPSYNDTMVQIFDKTVFKDMESLNFNALTDSQKRAIIADQIAVLFISQHPAVCADNYPSKIIGFGVDESVLPTKVLTNAIIYGKKYPDVIPLVNNRLFGMVATYKTFNYVMDLESVISDYNQSTQKLIDPVRIVCTDSDGVVSDSLGINGIIFAPYAVNVVGVETMTDVPNPIIFTCNLYENLLDIDNLQITDNSGGDITPHSNVIKVSFDVVYGANNIKQIKYVLMSKNELNYAEYIDTTGLTRSYTFVLDNSVITDPVNNGDILIAQIDIEDVEGDVLSYNYTKFAQGYTERPALSDLRFYQRNDGSYMIDVFYWYDGKGEINSSYIYFEYSLDGGVNWSFSENLKGDVANEIMPGRRKISWNAAEDLMGIQNNYPVLVRLTLYSTDKEVAAGDVLTGALTWNFSKPEVAVRRITQAEQDEIQKSSSSSSLSSSSSSYMENWSSSSLSSSSLSSSSFSDSSLSNSSSLSSLSSLSSTSSLMGCHEGWVFDPGEFTDPLLNGTYLYNGSYYNGMPVYYNGNFYMFFGSRLATYYWCISAAVGDPEISWEARAISPLGCPDVPPGWVEL